MTARRTVSAGELLSPSLIDDVRRHHGDADEGWLGALPDLVERCLERWDLGLTGVLPVGSYSVVLSAWSTDHGDVVLKVASDATLLSRECAALQAWSESGTSVRVLAFDATIGVALLERLVPGSPVSELPPTEDVDGRVAGVLAGMADASTVAIDLPAVGDDLGDLVRRQTAAGPPFEPADIDHAETLIAELTDASLDRVVHGDFHDDNVLDGGARGLVAIDPRPCLGDPAADAGNWAVQRDRSRKVLPRITTLASATEGDVERIRAWARVYATIIAGSLVRFGWGDPGDAERFLGFARTGRGSED